MREGWRFFALLMVAANLLILATLAFGYLVFSHNLRAVAAGQPICLSDYRAYDGVTAALQIGRLDLVSFLLTAGGLLFAAFAFVGFWAVRRDVMDRATEIASDTARQVTQELYARENGSGTRGDSASDTPYMDNRGKVSFPPNEVSLAGAVEDKGESDEKSE